MADTPADRIAAYLAEAGERSRSALSGTQSFGHGATMQASAADVPPLLAAVEKVLAEADRWAALAPPDDWGESMHGTALADAGRSLREAISRELLGEGETDGH